VDLNFLLKFSIFINVFIGGNDEYVRNIKIFNIALGQSSCNDRSQKQHRIEVRPSPKVERGLLSTITGAAFRYRFEFFD
jgi:hypothetical protein